MEFERDQGYLRPLFSRENRFRARGISHPLKSEFQEYTRKQSILSAFPDGDKVHHTVFGDGVVERQDEDAGLVVVRFEGFGLRRLKPETLKPFED